MRKTILIFFVSGLLALGILIQPQFALPLAGQWGVVFGIDAPWRLEPIHLPNNRGYGYGQIPIVISFRQAINEGTREKGIIYVFARNRFGLGSSITVGKITSVQVTEIVQNLILPDSNQVAPQPITQILPAQFREVERKRLLSTKENDQVCCLV